MKARNNPGKVELMLRTGRNFNFRTSGSRDVPKTCIFAFKPDCEDDRGNTRRSSSRPAPCEHLEDNQLANRWQGIGPLPRGGYTATKPSFVPRKWPYPIPPKCFELRSDWALYEPWAGRFAHKSHASCPGSANRSASSSTCIPSSWRTTSSTRPGHRYLAMPIESCSRSPSANLSIR